MYWVVHYTFVRDQKQCIKLQTADPKGLPNLCLEEISSYKFRYLFDNFPRGCWQIFKFVIICEI